MIKQIALWLNELNRAIKTACQTEVRHYEVVCCVPGEKTIIAESPILSGWTVDEAGIITREG